MQLCSRAGIDMVLIVLPLLTLALIVLFGWRPIWAIHVLYAEAILGGNGRWLELFGGAITPRYLIFVATFGGWIVYKLTTRFEIARIRTWVTPFLFAIVLFHGIVRALLFGNSDFLSEAQVWLYLLAYPMIVDLARRDANLPYRLIRRFLIYFGIMTFAQLSMIVLFNANRSVMSRALEVLPLTQMRIAVNTTDPSGFVPIFWGNAPVAALALAVSLLILSTVRGGALLTRRRLWLIATLVPLGLIGTWTRGIWVQLLMTLMLVLLDSLMRGRLPMRIVLAIFTAAALGASAVMSVPAARTAFVSRILTILPSHRDAIEPSDSIVLKAVETERLLSAIAARPFFGHGFGEGDFSRFGLEEKSRFHNYFLGFALKTGWSGLAILLAMLATICLRALAVGIAMRRSSKGAILRGMAYGLITGVVISTTNPHIATPAFVLAVGLTLAVCDVFQQEARRVRYHRAPQDENEHLHRQLQLHAAT